MLLPLWHPVFLLNKACAQKHTCNEALPFLKCAVSLYIPWEGVVAVVVDVVVVGEATLGGATVA